MTFMFKVIHYCQLFIWKLLKYVSSNIWAWSERGLLDLLVALIKSKVKLDLLTNMHMLLIVEKGIRGGICYSIYWYSKANNKYMKHYDENKESTYLQYCDINNLYDWTMSQKLPVNHFQWIEDPSQFHEDFIKNSNVESDGGYFFEDDAQYLEKLHKLHNDLPHLPEKMKIEKVEKLAGDLHDKPKYIIHIRNLKEALNHRLVLKKVPRKITFNQNILLKPCIDMNTDIRKKAKNDFEKDFF